MRTWKVLAIFLLVFTAGCAPIPQHSYVPDAGEGRIVHSQCPFNTHLPVGIAFAREDVQLTVSLRKNHGRDYVSLQFQVPDGKTVVLQGNAITLDRGNSQPVQESVFENVNLDHGQMGMAGDRTLPLSSPLVGAKDVIGDTSFSKNFWLATYIDFASAQDFRMTLPAFTINGVPSGLNAIHYQRRLVVVVALINC